MKDMNNSHVSNDKIKTSRRGRKALGETPMSQRELSARHREKLRAAGGMVITVRVADGNLVGTFKQVKAAKGFKTDTALGAWLILEMLKIIKNSPTVTS